MEATALEDCTKAPPHDTIHDTVAITEMQTLKPRGPGMRLLKRNGSEYRCQTTGEESTCLTHPPLHSLWFCLQHTFYSQGTQNLLFRQQLGKQPCNTHMRPSAQGPASESSLLTITTQVRPPNCLTERGHSFVFLTSWGTQASAGPVVLWKESL